MLFTYKVLDASGQPFTGSIDALTREAAENALQRRGYVISHLAPASAGSLWSRDLSFWRRVKGQDIVILSRQIATLFEAQISALRIFRLLAAEGERQALRDTLLSVSDDLQAGSSISNALGKHPDIFSNFYVQMVRSGEETGKLDETFLFLADYLERSYEVASKAKNALIYPAFVVLTFCGVMVLMLTTVIPSISRILTESGQAIPLYTKLILGLSAFVIGYGWFLLILAILATLVLWRFGKTPRGRFVFSELKISVPYIGTLFRKLYLSRIADTLHTELGAAIPIVKALELTADVVDNAVFKDALSGAADGVKGGSSIADSLARSSVFPAVMLQMVKVGEESGELAKILQTLGRFYRREVANAVDTLVSLIEPALIVLLGLGVGFLLAAVLIPIYNIAGAS